MIIPMTEQHLDAVAALEQACFTDPYSRSLLESELANTNSLYLVDCLPDGTVRGYAGLNIVLDEGHITNIATAPDYRRQGIAAKLLHRQLVLCKTLGLRQLQLEVRQSNEPALQLYRDAGFVEVGLRNNYYAHPTEAAVLMNLNLEELL